MVVKTIASFIMAPVIITALGNYDYGIWEITFSLVGYLGLLDLGMRPTVTRYTAYYLSKKDQININKLLVTSLAFNFIVGVIAFLIIISFFLVKYLIQGEPTTNHTTTKYLFFGIIIGVQVLFQFPGYVFECYHRGKQQFAVINNITIFNTIVGNIIIYLFLKSGYGILTLALGNCIGVSLKYVAYALLTLKRKENNIRLTLKNFSKDILKQNLIFGGKSMAAGLSATIASTVDKLTIGALLGPQMIPFYSIPVRLFSYIWQFNTTIANVFMPAFSEMHAKEQHSDIFKLYSKATRYIVTLIIPIIILASQLGADFIGCWIGPDYRDAANTIIYFIAIGFTFQLINPLFARLLTGMNIVGDLAKIRWFFTIILSINTIIGVKFYQLTGAAIAFMTTYIMLFPAEMIYLRKKCDLRLKRYLATTYLPVIPPSLILLLLVSYTKLLISPSTYINIITISVLTGTIYLFSAYIFAISKEERSHLHFFIQRIIKFN